MTGKRHRHYWVGIGTSMELGNLVDITVRPGQERTVANVARASLARLKPRKFSISAKYVGYVKIWRIR